MSEIKSVQDVLSTIEITVQVGELRKQTGDTSLFSGIKADSIAIYNIRNGEFKLNRLECPITGDQIWYREKKISDKP